MRTPMPDDEGDLPNIDDLQIAAGAAAGKKDPVWPVLRKALGEVHSSDEEDEEHDNKAAVSAAPTDEDMQEALSQVMPTNLVLHPSLTSQDVTCVPSGMSRLHCIFMSTPLALNILAPSVLLISC